MNLIRGFIRNEGNHMEFKINTDTWKVVVLDGEHEKMHPEPDRINLGLTEYCKNVINIRKGMTESVTRATVIHELVHAFLFSFGYHVEGEEPMCDFFGVQGDSILELADKIMKGVNFDVDNRGN